MRATLMYAAGDVRVENVPDARLIEPTDALVSVTRACICGSDLWPYNSMEPARPAGGWDMSPSAASRTSARGAHVQGRRPRRARPFPGPTAPASSARMGCRPRASTAAASARMTWTAVRPKRCEYRWRMERCSPSGRQRRRADALASHTLGCDGDRPSRRGRGEGRRAKASRRRRWRRRPVRSDRREAPWCRADHPAWRHPDRIALGQEFGATDVVSERGEEAVERVRELTGGLGAHSVLECVGLEQQSRPHSRSLVPEGPSAGSAYRSTTSLPTGVASEERRRIGGGPAPVRAYIEELLPDVLEGRSSPAASSTAWRARRGAGRLPRDERARSPQVPDRALGKNTADWRGSRFARVVQTTILIGDLPYLCA